MMKERVILVDKTDDSIWEQWFFGHQFPLADDIMTSDPSRHFRLGQWSEARAGDARRIDRKRDGSGGLSFVFSLVWHSRSNDQWYPASLSVVLTRRKRTFLLLPHCRGRRTATELQGKAVLQALSWWNGERQRERERASEKKRVIWSSASAYDGYDDDDETGLSSAGTQNGRRAIITHSCITHVPPLSNLRTVLHSFFPPFCFDLIFQKGLVRKREREKMKADRKSSFYRNFAALCARPLSSQLNSSDFDNYPDLPIFHRLGPPVAEMAGPLSMKCHLLPTFQFSTYSTSLL